MKTETLILTPESPSRRRFLLAGGAVMRSSINNVNPPRLVFADPNEGERWLAAMSSRLARYVPDAAERRQRLAQIEEGAYFASERGLIVNAGHGLNIHNVAPIAKILPIAELNIGHALIAQALFLGLPAAIVQMKEAMFRARLSI